MIYPLKDNVQFYLQKVSVRGYNRDMFMKKMNKTLFFVQMLFFVITVTGCGVSEEKGKDSAMGYQQISQEEAKEIIANEDNIIILDVRTQEEYDQGHIPDAVCVPVETLSDSQPEELPDLNQKILVYCRSGNRSKQAAEKLAAIGYTNIFEFGGINTWDGELDAESQACRNNRRRS